MKLSPNPKDGGAPAQAFYGNVVHARYTRLGWAKRTKSDKILATLDKQRKAGKEVDGAEAFCLYRPPRIDKADRLHWSAWKPPVASRRGGVRNHCLRNPVAATLFRLC